MLLDLGALTVTGIGPIVVAGPIAAALLGAGTGATIGGLVGLLVDADLDQEQAQLYAEGVRRDGTPVVVHAEEEEAQRAKQILDRHGPVDLAERSAGWQARVQEGSVVGQAPLALQPPPHLGLLRTVRPYLPGAALFAGGLLLGFVLGPTAPEE